MANELCGGKMGKRNRRHGKKSGIESGHTGDSGDTPDHEVEDGTPERRVKWDRHNTYLGGYFFGEDYRIRPRSKPSDNASG